jgi:hypothetical protein
MAAAELTSELRCADGVSRATLRRRSLTQGVKIRLKPPRLDHLRKPMINLVPSGQKRSQSPGWTQPCLLGWHLGHF